MKECPKCQACYDGIGLRCRFDSCDLIETVPCDCTIAAKYRIESRLGEGRLGAVYRAIDLRTQCTVAVKLLLPHRASNKPLAADFRRRVSAASQLRHPNLVPVIDFGLIEAGDIMLGYVVMEFVEGWPLSTLIRDQKRLSISRAVEVLDDVCAGLSYAHERGLVHGALNPQNIWLCSEGVSREIVKLLDCGLDFAAVDETSAVNEALTHAEARVRSLYYLSPEQCAGHAPDARSDIYSLGAVAYEMLTGAPPFLGEPDQLRRKQIRSRPRSLWLWHRVPYRVSRVVHRALAKNPRRRFQSTNDFLDNLLRASDKEILSNFRPN